jgi:diaminopimelate decarboxylase
MPQKADVAIVGGGVIGASVAFHLAERGGIKVILFERDTLGGGETSASPALLMHQTGNSELSLLAKLSVKEYASRADKGVDIGYHRSGSIVYTTRSEEALLNYVKIQQALDIPTKSLSQSEIANMVPFVNTADIKAGVYCPLDSYVDPGRLSQFYAQGARDGGVDIRQHVEVIGVRTAAGRVTGVETSEGYVETKTLVNASGALAHHIGQYVGLELPVKNEIRNIVVVGPTALGEFPIMEHAESEWYFRAFNHDRLLAGVGYTVDAEREPRDLRPAADPNAALATSQFFNHRVPKIASAHVVAQWSGIRSLTPKGIPIIGHVEGVEGFLNCCCWSGFGITCADAAGRLMADLILDGQTKLVDVDPFLFRNHEPEPLQWERKKGHLLLGDQTLLEVAGRFGTPLYLYDSRIILDRLKRITDAFPDFEILYSLKSNPNPFIATILARSGMSAEVGSVAELRTALSAGFPPGKITFGGPSKRESELEEAVASGVATIDVESLSELRAIEDLGVKHQRRIPVTLRINTLYRPAVAGELMAGGPSEFGIDEENLIENLKGTRFNYVDYQGVHAHVASQVLDAEALAVHFSNLAHIAKKFSSELGFELKIINFGGGIGVPYARREQNVALGELGRKIRRTMSEAFGHLKEKPRLQMEPGRYLVAESGIFLTRILDKKYSRGTNYLITESGISGFSRPAMPWAQQHLCSIVSKQDVLPVENFKVVGRSCLPSDVLSESTPLPDPQPGEILAVSNTGAYGYTMSFLLWASQLPPIEVVFHDGKLTVARERLTSGVPD